MNGFSHSSHTGLSHIGNMSSNNSTSDTNQGLSNKELKRRVKEITRKHIFAHPGLLENGDSGTTKEVRKAREAQAANVKNALAEKLEPVSSTCGVSITPNGSKYISVRCQYRSPNDNSLTNCHVTVKITDTRNENKSSVSELDDQSQLFQTKNVGIITIIIIALITSISLITAFI